MPSVDGTNYPGPWELRINYLVDLVSKTRAHQLRMSVDVDTPPDPGSDFGDYDLKSRQGLFYDAESWTDAFVDKMKAIYKTTTTITSAELWLYATGTYNAAFQSAYSIAVAGTSASSIQLWSQQILTFRSQNGGIAKINFMESIFVPAVLDAYPTSLTAINDIFDLVSSLSSPVIARDGGYLFAPLNYLSGQNEHLFKLDYR